MNRVAVLLLAAVSALSVQAQSKRPAEPSAPNIRKIATFDSGTAGGPRISPNGKWVAFMSSGAIWTAPTDGRGRATRLLSPGYSDRAPLWFQSSDALVFTSNRPARNGSNKHYGMVVNIDPSTGRASGPPRAVTTDEVQVAGYPSPDGKSIVYLVAGGDSIKVVPSIGGTARLVAKAPEGGAAGPPMWYADGKSILFSGRADERNIVKWYRVPATGGTPILVEHAPFFGLLHLHGDREQPQKRLELRDSAERLVSALDVPAGMGVALFNYTTAGAAVMNARRYVSHIYSVETGAHRVIDGWSDGWTSDGKNYMMELKDGPIGSAIGSVVAAAVVDASGKVVSKAAMPADAGGCCGWQGVVGSSYTFTRHTEKGLFVADAQAGRVWQLSPDFFWDSGWAMPLVGRGGQGFSDDGRFLYTTSTDKAIEVRAGTEANKATLLRSFPARDTSWQQERLDGSHGIGVFGDRLAWTDRTRDSVTVWMATGPTGTARRVTSLPSPRECSGDRRGKCHTEVVWSARGDALAVVTMDNHPLMAVLRLREDGSLAGAPTMLEPGVKEPWCVRWVDGDRALAMIGVKDRPGTDDVIVVPVNGSASRVLTQGQAGEWMWVSPNGKEILFPEVVTTGSSIYRLDFVPAKK
ncbi:MAG TPA: hypothetical protein VE967_12560 [Gemmatimonadaceae bacterium]|nr:hypothetical protein [Gemmatimonadaceae bacterium]